MRHVFLALALVLGLLVISYRTCTNQIFAGSRTAAIPVDKVTGELRGNMNIKGVTGNISSAHLLHDDDGKGKKISTHILPAVNKDVPDVNKDVPGANKGVDTRNNTKNSKLSTCQWLQQRIAKLSWLKANVSQSWADNNCEKIIPVLAPTKIPNILNKCLLVANGPSLNNQKWDFHQFDYTIGMNKIYLGLNKFSLRLHGYVVVNPLVAAQSVPFISDTLHPLTEKYVCKSQQSKFPKNKKINFIKSSSKPPFSTNIHSMNEGWTVTYVALQILYIKGCKAVYIIGMDHYFKQTGKPNSKQMMKHDDPNHFDSSYFKGHNWHLADLKRNEQHYKIARKFYEDHNRSIIDATVNGHCNIFMKVKHLN